MEIYKDLSTPASKEFEKLLNSQLSKVQIDEGKIIEGKINKITDKYVFLHCEGLKSEPVLDINELKSMGLGEKIKVGEKIPVLLERLDVDGTTSGFDELLVRPLRPDGDPVLEKRADVRAAAHEPQEFVDNTFPKHLFGS